MHKSYNTTILNIAPVKEEYINYNKNISHFFKESYVVVTWKNSLFVAHKTSIHIMYLYGEIRKTIVLLISRLLLVLRYGADSVLQKRVLEHHSKENPAQNIYEC